MSAIGDRPGMATLDNGGRTSLILRAYRDVPSSAYPNTTDRSWVALRADGRIIRHWNGGSYQYTGRRIKEGWTYEMYRDALIAHGYTIVNDLPMSRVQAQGGAR